MKTLLTVAVALLVAFSWMRGRLAGIRLESEVAALREQGAELDALHRERERLQALQPPPAELAKLQRAAAEHGETKRELAAREQPARSRVPQTLALGDWLPASRWKNLGSQTPNATVETALWAAAGGDVTALRNILQLDDAVLTKADALLAQLPADARNIYTDATQLIAAFTIKAIPLGDAQVVWQHLPAADEAVVCVFVNNPEAPTIPATNASRPAQNAPPMSPSSSRTHSAYLSLRRSDDGWRLVVPPSAVDRIAKELGLRTAAR